MAANWWKAVNFGPFDPLSSNKLNASMDFLLHLKEIGRKAAGAWLM